MKILIIDDSKTSRLILKKMFKDVNAEIYEAGHGREGLDRLKETGPVDLALVDWNMPEMNGYEFVKAVRAQSCYDDMRIMMVTTETEFEQMSLAIEAGANEYAMKPFTQETILDKVRLLGFEV